MKNEIMIIGELGELTEIKAENLYLNGDMDKVIAFIKEKATKVYVDTSTKQGLEEIRSLAYSVARCRTYLYKLGKDLTEEWRDNTKKVNGVRTKMEEELIALEELVRKPLTEIENKEKAKQELIIKISELKTFANANLANGADVKEIELRLETLKSLQVDETCEELIKAKEDSNNFLNELLIASKKRDAEKEELLRLRKIAEEAERKEREEKLQKEAEAKAQENALKQIELNKKQAQEAIAKAEKEKEEAVLAERKRIEDEQKRLAEETAKREQDVNHKKAINTQAKNDLIKIGLTSEQAIMVITAIAKNEISNVKINY